MENITLKGDLQLAPRQAKFFRFVKEQHGDQVRKYTGEPYWNHLVAVAFIVQQKVPDCDLLIEVALGHDLYEDTKCGSTDLMKFMRSAGYDRDEYEFIHEGIEALTDFYTHKLYPEKNRSERKRLETKRLAGIEGCYQSVKYADLIHNTESIVKYDKDFAKTYLQEKRRILDYMDQGDKDLHLIAHQVLKYADEEIKKHFQKKFTLFGVEVPFHEVNYNSSQRFQLPKVEVETPAGTVYVILHNHFDNRIEMTIYFKASKHQILWDEEGIALQAEHRILKIIQDYGT